MAGVERDVVGAGVEVDLLADAGAVLEEGDLVADGGVEVGVGDVGEGTVVGANPRVSGELPTGPGWAPPRRLSAGNAGAWKLPSLIVFSCVVSDTSSMKAVLLELAGLVPSELDGVDSRGDCETRRLVEGVGRGGGGGGGRAGVIVGVVRA